MKDNNEKLLNGLTQNQANERLKQYGYNDLEAQKSQTLLQIADVYFINSFSINLFFCF